MEKLKKFLYSSNEETNKILNLIIVIVFLIISLYVGYHHEPWSDEAQSWLIARDSSLNEIIFNVMRYEGTPPLWHLVLKVFIIFGLKYEYLYLVSTLFSTIGIWIIVYKLKVPNMYKILLPFTYFILYEYTVKARNYCLLLPILASIAWIYENRKAHVYVYNFLLGLLATVSLHGSLISGILFVFEIIEIIKGLQEKGNIKKYYKECVSVIILAILYSCIILIVYPAEDVYVSITIASIEENDTFITFFIGFIKILQAIILDKNVFIANLIISAIFFILLLIFSLKGNKNWKLFVSILSAIVLFLCCIRFVNQHIGLVLYTFLFVLYLTKNSIPEKNKNVLKILLTIMFIIQIIWSYKNIALEIDNTYSAGRDVAEYLKTLNYEELDIYASGYYATAILPYFDNNIFNNDRGGKNYYIWSFDNEDWNWASSEEYIYPDDIAVNSDIIILHTNYTEEKYTKTGYCTLVEKVRASNKYKETLYDGKAFFKGNIANSEGYYVFERIN